MRHIKEYEELEIVTRQFNNELDFTKALKQDFFTMRKKAIEFPTHTFILRMLQYNGLNIDKFVGHIGRLGVTDLMKCHSEKGYAELDPETMKKNKINMPQETYDQYLVRKYPVR